MTIGSVFKELYDTARDSIALEYENDRITKEQYAQSLIEISKQAIQTAVQYNLQAPVNEKQIDVMERETLIKEMLAPKDLELKLAEIDLTNARVTEIEAQKDLLVRQRSAIDEEINIKTNESNANINLKNKQIDVMERETDIKEAQSLKDLTLKDKEIEIKTKQGELYDRQRSGFDDDLKKKLMEIQMNAWAMMFSSGMLKTNPEIITNDEVSTLYNNIKSQLGIV